MFHEDASHGGVLGPGAIHAHHAVARAGPTSPSGTTLNLQALLFQPTVHVAAVLRRPLASCTAVSHVSCRMLWLHWDRWPMALSCSRSMRRRTRACRTPSASRCRCPSRPGCSPTAGPTTATGALGHTAAVASLGCPPQRAVHGSTHVSKGPLRYPRRSAARAAEHAAGCVVLRCNVLYDVAMAQVRGPGLPQRPLVGRCIHRADGDRGRSGPTHPQTRTHGRARARTNAHMHTHAYTHTHLAP